MALDQEVEEAEGVRCSSGVDQESQVCLTALTSSLSLPPPPIHYRSASSLMWACLRPMQSSYLELKIMALPASSLCVPAVIMEDNEPLTERGLMNKPSQSHRKEALDERKRGQRGC